MKYGPKWQDCQPVFVLVSFTENHTRISEGKMIPRLADAPGLEPKVSRWLGKLEKAQFGGEIDTRLAARMAVATDNSIYEILPQAVVFPKTPSDVATIMRTLNTPETRDIQIVPRGGGTGTNGQALAAGVVVDLSRHMRTIHRLDIGSKHCARRARSNFG